MTSACTIQIKLGRYLAQISPIKMPLEKKNKTGKEKKQGKKQNTTTEQSWNISVVLFVIAQKKVRHLSVLFHLPKASCVEWLTALQPRLQVLKIICELLILPKLHNVIEVFHMLHHCVQLLKKGNGVNYSKL